MSTVRETWTRKGRHFTGLLEIPDKLRLRWETLESDVSLRFKGTYLDRRSVPESWEPVVTALRPLPDERRRRWRSTPSGEDWYRGT